MIVRQGLDELELASASSVVDGFRLSLRIMPARGAARGGDWCETFVVSDHVVALSIGDVCGSGLDAFDEMLEVRSAVRNEALRGLGPARALASVNRTLCRQRPETYVSAIFGLLDTNRHTLTFANGGHPPPLMVWPFGQRFLEIGGGDFLLGIDADAHPAVHVVKVPADTLLVFYTDGVIEHARDAILGQAQLLDAAAFAHHYSALPAAPVIERQMSLTGSNHDDAAILAVRAPAARTRA
jgi:serine phosphatase RsbU (regulator of sigma subunit)